LWEENRQSLPLCRCECNLCSTLCRRYGTLCPRGAVRLALLTPRPPALQPRLCLSSVCLSACSPALAFLRYRWQLDYLLVHIPWPQSLCSLKLGVAPRPRLFSPRPASGERCAGPKSPLKYGSFARVDEAKASRRPLEPEPPKRGLGFNGSAQHLCGGIS